MLFELFFLVIFLMLFSVLEISGYCLGVEKQRKDWSNLLELFFSVHGADLILIDLSEVTTQSLKIQYTKNMQNS